MRDITVDVTDVRRIHTFVSRGDTIGLALAVSGCASAADVAVDSLSCFSLPLVLIKGFPMDEPTPADILRAQVRLAEIREDISSRLWNVNQGMSSASFNEVMDQMAVLQFSCERRIVEGALDGERRLGQLDRRTLSALRGTAGATEPSTDADS
ncbi:hypothetical protein BH11GEM2_BH11GEM2_35010 [soil metagenome]